MTTSFRTPSTCWAYQRGKVSLSPAVTITAYGSTLFNRSRAKSPVVVSPRREAACQFANSGMKAMARTGDASSQPRRVGVRVGKADGGLVAGRAMVGLRRVVQSQLDHPPGRHALRPDNFRRRPNTYRETQRRERLRFSANRVPPLAKRLTG